VVGPVVCPPQPTGLTAAAQDSGALVSWNDARAVVESELAVLAEDGVEDLPAASDVVTDIQVTVTAVADASDEQVVTVAGDARQARVSGLRNGVEYAVSVIAFGEFGAGPVSESIVFSPTTGVEGEIGGVLLKRDDAAKTAPASQSASDVDGVAVTDDGEALDGVDKVALSEAVDVAEGEAIARTIEAQPEVQWAEPDLVVLPATTDGGATDARSGWNITGEFGVGEVSDPDAGKGVTVAVIDTGITSHPDLDGRLVAGYDFVSNPEVLAAPRSEGGQPVPFDGDYTDEATYGGLGRDADPTDPGDWRGVAPVRDSTWHGTHTAGVIADVVPGAKIQPIRALSWRGGLLSDVAAGITWASGGTVDGVPANATPSQIINLSFSVQAACPNTLQTAIDDAVARGSVIVAAAGNNNADAIGYAPGNCANVITVGATNAEGKRASYSNFGAVVDASAPGATLRTAREGTSIAAAHTAAALALITSNNPYSTPTQRAAILTGEYLRNFPGDTCDVSSNKACGSGLLQVSASSLTAFGCEPELYQTAQPTSNIKAGNDTGLNRNKRLFVYGTSDNKFTPFANTFGSANMNATGYNTNGTATTADDFIYGIANNNLYKIGDNGSYEILRSGMGNPYVGDVWQSPSGPKLIFGGGSNNSFKSVDLDPDGSYLIENFHLNGDTFAAADFTIDEDTAYGLNGKSLYVVALGTKSVTTKTVDSLADKDPDGGFGSAYADAQGNIYFFENNESIVWRIADDQIPEKSPKISLLGVSSATIEIDGIDSGVKLTTPNDGASCPGAKSAYSATFSNYSSSSVGETSAVVSVDVVSSADLTSLDFCVGTSSSVASSGALIGCTDASFTIPDGTDWSSGASSSVTVNALSTTTQYYWQAVSVGSDGVTDITSYSEVQSFATTGDAAATLQTATSVGETTATLNGVVNSGNLPTFVRFCYGTNSDLSDCTLTNAEQSPLSPSLDNQPVSLVLSDLLAGTQYYFRLEASNDDGATWVQSSTNSLRTSSAPVVTLGSVTGKTTTEATLTASVNPKGLASTVHFCVSATSDLTGCPGQTPTQALVAVDSDLSVTADLSELVPASTYYFRVEASNANGDSVSGSGSFTTDARPLNLTATTGLLSNGQVGFSYSKSLSADGGVLPYSWTVTSGSLPPGLSLNSSSGIISGEPTEDGMYSFNVQVTDSNSPQVTASKSFSMGVTDRPNALTNEATAVSGTTATLNASVDAGNQIATVDFCYGTSEDLSICTTVAAAESPLSAATTSSSVTLDIVGLTASTTYYFKVTAANSSGSDTGEILSFTTNGPPVPVVGLATFRSQDGQEATLNATVNPRGLPTTVSFCYGPTRDPNACTSTSASESPLTAATAASAVSKTVTGLSANTVYYFWVTASNALGTVTADADEADGPSSTPVAFRTPTGSTPPPVVESVSSLRGPYTGGTTIFITGSNLNLNESDDSYVSIGGNNASIISWTSSRIELETPAGEVGNATIVLSNTDGQAFEWPDPFVYSRLTVSYDANGATSGNVPTDPSTYIDQDLAVVKTAGSLTQSGYVFTNWNTLSDGAGTSYGAGDSLTMTTDVVLYAQWSGVGVPALNTATVSFGTRSVGSSTPASRTVTLRNDGGAALTIDTPGISIAGAASGDFTLAGGTCVDGDTVGALTSCTMEINFVPLGTGQRRAQLSVSTSDGTVTATLTGATPNLGGGPGSSSGSSGESPSATLPPEATVRPPRRTLPVGVVLGAGVMVIDGQVVPVRPERAPSGGTWAVKGDDFSLEFVPRATDAGLFEGPEERLRAPVGGQVEVRGDGYLGESSVAVYLVPPELLGRAARASAESIYLGDVTVGANGTFDVTLTVPGDVDPGDFVLQVNGWSEQAAVRSVNMNIDLYETLTTRSITKAAFFKGRATEMSKNGERKLRSMVGALPAARENVQVDITAVSVSLDGLESDLRLAARRGRELRDYLSERGVRGTYSVTIRTEDQLRSADKTPPLLVSSKGKPLTTVRITYDTSQ